MSFRNLPGPAKLALAIMAWALILWVFTLGYPAFAPVARFIFGALVLPCALAEWLKMKGVVTGRAVSVLRMVLIAFAVLLWLINTRT
ncbi:hypothetical protein [Desulfofundulus thermosubterraneus]|uniref:Uncharacterized protein n=1 Tax=Desulfofundulus thermosubterraneus DSM 16057 TaxID=1121432 RepID=A0A1M6BAV9_9FIRM|nr:hypothetical protein [Desulfofundulus thermosubterraneus]SHI45826.1 hypothetical protein SAMN02745219_00370 [Desulfofundulus thermosubterraneus DSM 16057]